jgi:hypothetical protein
MTEIAKKKYFILHHKIQKSLENGAFYKAFLIIFCCFTEGVYKKKLAASF